MVNMISKAADMLRRSETNKIPATVSPEGDPHAIICGSLLVSDDGSIIVGEVLYECGMQEP